MEQIEYLDRYEQDLMQHMLRMLTSMGLLNRQLLESEDISDKWDEIAPSYVQDAVREIAEYPTVALGWAMYMGMAVAHFWDKDWEFYSQMPNLYEYLREKRGFDFLDEVVRGEVLGLEGEEFAEAEKIVQGCSQQVLDKIRHEQIDPQSPTAFHVFARSIHTLYLLGAAIQLKAMGYSFEKVN